MTNHAVWCKGLKKAPPNCGALRVAELQRVDAFIDTLDLAALGFERVVPEVTGRPGYHPETLLKIYLYGYLSIRSNPHVAWSASAAAISR